jgi:hypothetical protein
MRIDPCYDKKYGWFALLLLFIVSNILWIIISLERSSLHFTTEEGFQLGTLIATASALIISIIYNILTIRESRILRESQISPELAGNIVWIGPVDIALKVQNVGAGSALNTSLSIELISKNPTVPSLKKEFSYPLMASQDSNEYDFANLNIFQLTNDYEKIKGLASCKDIIGKSHHFEWEIVLDSIMQTPSVIFQVWYDPREAAKLAEDRNKLLEKQNILLEEQNKLLQKQNNYIEQIERKLP